MEVKFVNRSREIAFLSDQKALLGKSNNVIVICGNSGIGKSKLTEHFLRQSIDKAPCIKVRIQQAEREVYEAGYFFTKTARAFHEASMSDERIRSLPRFLKESAPTGIIANKLWKSIQTDIADAMIFKETIKTTIDLLTEKGDFETGHFFQSTDSEVLYALHDYVSTECKRVPIILNIENIQSTDERSWAWLLSTMRESNNCLFILEYTDDDKRGYTFHDITASLEKESIPVTAYPLNPLNLEEVQKIFQEFPSISWELLQKSYVSWDGNLRSLVDVLARVKYKLPTSTIELFDVNSATKDHLNSLSKGELFLLTIIYTHKEPTQRSLLARLATYKEAFQYILDIHSTLKSLEGRSLIRFSNDEIVIAHDSINSGIPTTSHFGIYSIISQRFWLAIYDELLDSNDVYTSKGWRLMRLLYFSSLLNQEAKIYKLLDQISDEALKSRDPQKMISYVRDVRVSIWEKVDVYTDRIRNLDYWMVELLYKIGENGKAWAIFKEIKDTHSAKNNILRAILLEQMGFHHDALDFCSLEIDSGASLKRNYELALRLVRLVTNYDVGNNEEASKEFYYIYGNSKFRKLFEYGFLLRNAELILSYKDSLPYYQESIKHFIKHGAIRQAAFSRITYGVHLGLIGKLEAAKKQFDLANSELANVISERHTLLNNYAILLLYQNNVGDETENLLRQAMLTASSDFERITIHIGYLVMMDWRGNDQEAERAIDVILNILKDPSFASKEIIRYAYFDIYKYYEDRDMDRAKTYLAKIHDLGLTETPIWRYWLYGEEVPIEDEEYFSSSINRAISFLCNWNMEYDSRLMKY